jgi:hypothetical protein
MEVYGVVEVELHVFLTSALNGGEWSALLSGRYTPGERAPRYGNVSLLRAKRLFPAGYRTPVPRSPVLQPSPDIDWAIPAHRSSKYNG